MTRSGRLVHRLNDKQLRYVRQVWTRDRSEQLADAASLPARAVLVGHGLTQNKQEAPGTDIPEASTDRTTPDTEEIHGGCCLHGTE